MSGVSLKLGTVAYICTYVSANRTIGDQLFATALFDLLYNTVQYKNL